MDTQETKKNLLPTLGAGYRKQNKKAKKFPNWKFSISILKCKKIILQLLKIGKYFENTKIPNVQIKLMKHFYFKVKKTLKPPTTKDLNRFF